MGNKESRGRTRQRKIARERHTCQIATEKPHFCRAFGVGIKSPAMTEPLLTTKLAPPPLRAQFVARPRLTAKLDEGTARALTLISATAGFGKTTLVSEWLSGKPNGGKPKTNGTRPLPTQGSVAWLALDADDNTPTRLLRHVIGALQRVAPTWGERVLARLDENPLESFTDIPDALLNELNTLTQPCIIILDDYHLITSPEIHNAFGYALEHLPAQVHLILITRADPPLPLARLRARDQLVEIRASDLAFTPAEAAQFLNQVMGLKLAPDQISALEKRTEGWIAGLQLAALSLRGQSDVNAFIENFTGNDRYIFDYLAEEVIRKLDAATRAFLLSTSILDRVCASLGQAVSGMADTLDVLDRLEHANLFTIALDTRREWYRYHHLFGELLRHELRQTRAAEIPTLHRRAAEWYQEHEMYAEAISHWLAAKEYANAAPLIEANVIGCLERAEFTTMLSWLDALPQEYRTRYPRLALAQVWAFMVLGQFEQAEAQLTNTAARLTDPADIAQLEALRALFVGLRGGTQDRIAHATRAYANAATGTDFTRGLAAMNLGTSYLFEGDLAAAYTVLGEAEQLVRGAGNHALATIAAGARADTDILRGNLHRAHESLEKILDSHSVLADRNLLSVNPVIGGLAEIEREWNQLDAARAKLERIRQNMRDELGVQRFYLTYAAVLRAQGQFDAAQASLEQARNSSRRFHLSIFQTQLSAEQGILHLVQGDMGAAEKWFHARGVHLDTPVTFVNEAPLLVFAELLLAQQRTDDALILLEQLHTAVEPQARTPRLILTELLQAMAYARQGKAESAHEILTRALRRAEPEGYVRLFVDRGARLLRLLSSLKLTDPRLETYRAVLLAAFQHAPVAVVTEAVPVADTLSVRELEILKLVATGLSNGEIAQQLVLTSGTVKWHVNNILNKLDVHNRTQAVARARQIRILA